MSKYMIILIFSGAVPFILSFWPPLRFYKNSLALLYSICGILFIYGAWDVFATWRGHWSFNSNGVWGLRILNLPLEELLFFIVIPFCCIFTWEVIKYIKLRLK